MILGIYGLPLRGPQPGLPSSLVGLSDTAPARWDWAAPGSYGLADDGSGGWVWTDAPAYKLDPETLAWAAV